MLVLGVDGVEAIKIGEDLIIGVHYTYNEQGVKKYKLSFAVPRETRIERVSGEEWANKSGKTYLKEIPRKR